MKRLLCGVVLGVFAVLATPALATERGEAIFAAGCFWCSEAAFLDVPGVTSVTSGYTGGKKVNPTYEEVSSGSTGHYESVRVLFDPQRVSYAKLLDIFWHNVDPFNADGQFCDEGSQYRSAIFYFDEAQKNAAEASRQAVQKKLNKQVVTALIAASTFYPAEAYHQKFCRTSPARYSSYRAGCGRDRRLHQVWGAEAPNH
jgi:peptide-methionine (S)-S-oxide reductase